MHGQRIREIRKNKGISLSHLARMSDVSKSYLSLIERGQQKNPSIRIVVRITNALNVDLKTIIIPHMVDEERNNVLHEEDVSQTKSEKNK